MTYPSLCLVNPPLTGSVKQCYLPVGLLSLAASARAAGANVRVLDLHVEVQEGRIDLGALVTSGAERIIAQGTRVIGFTTMCTSYITSARLAQRCKAIDPALIVIFGGPQASAIDRETLDLCPWVDIVVRGEGEDTLPELLAALGTDGALDGVAGITYRAPRTQAPTRTRSRPARQDLATLPIPAYDLLPLSSYRNNLAIEGGRGCPFSCTYCCVRSAFDQSYRQYRVAPPQRILEEMVILMEASGVSCFSILHPLFTCDKRFVGEFCDALLASGKSLYWSCTARTNTVPRELLMRMASAGCGGIFFGAESGSDEMLKIVHKRVKASATLAAVRNALSAGIRPTVSLMLGFREETREQLNDTLELALTCANHPTVQVDLHLVSLLPQTEMWHQHKDKLLLTEFALCCGDMGLGRTPTHEERQLLASNSDAFASFYSLVPEHLSLQLLHTIRVGFAFVLTFHARSFRQIMLDMSRTALECYEQLLEYCDSRFDFENPAISANIDDWETLLFGTGLASGMERPAPPMQPFEILYGDWIRSNSVEDGAAHELLVFETHLLQLRQLKNDGPPATASPALLDSHAIIRTAAWVRARPYSYDVTDTLSSTGSYKPPQQRDVLVAANAHSGTFITCSPLVMAVLAAAAEGIATADLVDRALSSFSRVPDDAHSQLSAAVGLLLRAGFLVPAHYGDGGNTMEQDALRQTDSIGDSYDDEICTGRCSARPSS